MKEKFLGGLYLSLAASFWGGMYVASKYVMDYISPITLVWVRYFISVIILFFWIYFTKSKNNLKLKIEKIDFPLILAIGLIGYFSSIIMQFVGTDLSDAHTGSLITSTTPVFMVIFGRIILKEKLNYKKIISLILAFIGVLIIIGSGDKEESYVLGSVILFMAGLTWALMSVLVRVASRKYDSLIITFFGIFIAFVLITPIALVEISKNGLSFGNFYGILGTLYIGIIATALGFFLWNKGMSMVEASIGSLFFFFQPVTGSLFGWLLLKEKLTLNFFIGGAFVILGIVIVSLGNKKKAKKTSKDN